MTSKFKTRVTALVLSAALSVNQALAFSSPPADSGTSGGGAPELDGPGGIAAIAFIVSVALVLFNRSRNR